MLRIWSTYASARKRGARLTVASERPTSLVDRFFKFASRAAATPRVTRASAIRMGARS